MAIKRDGRVTTGTSANLVTGLRSAPMSQAAVNAVRAQVDVFAELLINTYSGEIASGEVGLDGSGEAGDQPILGDRPPRILMYGRVQSGKTVAMILASALCLDNGFKVVVVLTTDNVALIRQTAARFKDLDGPRVFSSVKDEAYEWEGQEEELRDFVATDGVVLVCAKDAIHLPRVMRFLQQIDASRYPVLILDDEADAATPDTTLAARLAGRANAPQFPSTIHRYLVENEHPNQAGLSFGEILPHSMFVQVTATPQVLFLQRIDAALRPTETFLLEPGDGYCGGQVFFGDFDVRPGAQQPTTIVVVRPDEATTVRRAVSPGLAGSINYFILAACARSLAVGHWPAEGFKHLSHTSHLMDDHTLVSGHIERHLNGVRQSFRSNASPADFFHEAYTELQRSIPEAPTLESLLDVASSAVRQVEVVKVNSAADVPVYGPRINFLIGGNILGRGLTIDDLLTTYYIREAQTSQMDTVWQHARMYGYRNSYLDYIRIYLPHRLGARFLELHRSEEGLRSALAADASGSNVIFRVPRATRPTRPNALPTRTMRTIPAGHEQVHPRFLFKDAVAAAQVLQMLEEAGVPIDAQDQQDRPTRVPLSFAYDLVSAVRVYEGDPGYWQPETIFGLIQGFEQQLADECHVYVRRLEQDCPTAGWARGRLGGPEIGVIRRAAGPVPALALMYWGQDGNAPEAWYPTLLMPTGQPAFVFAPR